MHSPDRYRGLTTDDLLIRLADYGSSKGADVIGYEDVDGSIKTVHGKLDELSKGFITDLFVSIKYYSYLVVNNDWTVAIQTAMNDVCNAGGGTIFFPKGEYKANAHIDWRSNVHLEAIPGTVVIYADNDVVCSKFSWIWNKGYAFNYNATTVDVNMSAYGITFDWRRATSLGPSEAHDMIAFANAQNITFEKCQFLSLNSLPDQGTCITLLDIAASWKNVTVRDCKFDLRSNATVGGCLWIKNYATVAAPINLSEDILIENCDFYQEERDEILAIFTSNYNIRKVRIYDCTIHKAVGTVNGNVALTIAASTATSVLEDVEMTGCKIIVDDYIHGIMQINSFGTAKHISVHHNYFYAQCSVDAATNNTHLIVQNTAVANVDIHVDYNYFYLTGSNDIYYGFMRVMNATGNYIEGAIRIGFYECDTLIDNVFKQTTSAYSTLIGIQNCNYAVRNKLYNVTMGIRLAYSNGDNKRAVLEMNEIYLQNIAATGIYLRVASGSFTGRIKIHKNYVQSINASTKWMHVENTTWIVDIQENFFDGPGQVYQATPITFRNARNNDWNGYNDTIATALPTAGSGLLAALPLGHEIRNGTSGTASKWVRTSVSTNTATDWTSLSGS